MLIRNYDYRQTLPCHEVLVTLDDRAGYFEDLSKDMAFYGEKYGFSLREGYFNDEEKGAHSLSHLILITGYEEGLDFWNELKIELGQIKERYSSATVCISYKKSQDFNDARPIIDRWKSEFGASINFLRPDDKKEPILPNYVKVLDNAVCDTVRVKYRPLRRSSEFVLPEPVRDFFISCSELYQTYELFHRASTDGFFCCRHLNQIYITSTRTNKMNINLSRICQIHDFNEEQNEIVFSGPFIPSSDSVEACVLLKELPHVSAILHTHASDKITRNPKMKDHILVPPLPYGESELGYSIVNALKEKLRGWGILEDHGEIFLSSSEGLNEAFSEINATVRRVLNDS